MLSRVRRQSTCGALVVALVVAAAPLGTTSAEWQVRRTQADVHRDGARAFAASPRSPAAAAKLVRDAGPTRTVELIQQFGARAAAPSAGYDVVLAHAQLLLAANRWDEAAVAFSRAIALAPNDWLPRWGAGRAQQSSGDADQAARSLRDALDRAQRPADIRRVGRALLEAAVSARDGDAEIRARRALVDVATSHERQHLLWSLAQALDASGRSREAADILADTRPREAGLAETERARWAIAEARFRVSSGELAAADETLAAVCARAPRAGVSLRLEAWSLRIGIARQSGTTPALIAELSSPRDAVEWLAAAQLLEEAGDLANARRALARATKARPFDLELRRKEIDFVDRHGPRSELVPLHEALAAAALRISSVRHDPHHLLDALETLWRLREEPKAGALFDRALVRLAHAPRALRALAEAATRGGDDGRAMRAWAALLAAQPHDESAIVAVGEIHLARQSRDQAIRTWRRILGQGRASIEARLRFADVLADHDLVRDAFRVADDAVRRAPSDPRTLRSRALLHERLGQLASSEADWNAVLRVAAGPHRGDERREARAHLVNIWTRRGRHHLERELASMEQRIREQRARAQPGDNEMLTFLVDARLRAGQLDGAQTALRRLLDAEREAGGPAEARNSPGEPVVQAIFTLVTHLRQARRADEANRWLEEIARRWPQHARSAQLQLADIAVATRQDASARRHIDAVVAAAAQDPNVLLRLAALEERLGDLRRAAALYRRAAAASESGEAEVALAAVLLRLGEDEEARARLRKPLREATEGSAATEAGLRLAPLEEADGHGPLDRLTRDLAAAAARQSRELPSAPSTSMALRPASGQVRTKPSGAYSPSWRELALAVADRHLSAARSRRPDVAGADEAAFAPIHSLLNPLTFDLLPLAAGDADIPHTAAPEVELLGRANYEPASGLLIRLLDTLDRRGRLEPGRTSRTDRELAHATIVALGRVGGAEAQSALARMSSRRLPSVRSAALWALGRIGSRTGLEAAATRALLQALEGGDEQTALACLAMGRARVSDAGDRLVRIATLPQHPSLVRRAAVTGLAAGRYIEQARELVPLLQDADDALAETAAAALVVLWSDAGVGRMSGNDIERLITQSLALDGTESVALQRHASFVLDGAGSPSQLGDDAGVMRGESWTAEDVLASLIAPVAHRPPTGEWMGRFHDRTRALLVRRLASDQASERTRTLSRLHAQMSAADAGSPPAHGFRELLTTLKPELAARAASRGADERFAALQILAAISPDSVNPADVSQLIRRDERAGVALTRTLARSAADLAGPSAPPAPSHFSADQLDLLAVALTPSSEDGWSTRLALVEALAWLPRSVARERTLRAALLDPSAFVRSAAARALDAGGDQARP